MEAALELFASGSEEAVTIDRLAELSGTSIGSLYHHYGSKDEILWALYQHCLELYRLDASRALEGLSSAQELIQALVRHYLNWVESHPVESRLLLRQRHSQALAVREGTLRASTQDFVRELLARLQTALSRGEIRKLPAPLYQPVVLGPSIEFCRQWLSDRSGGLSPAQVADSMAEAAWRAVRTD